MMRLIDAVVLEEKLRSVCRLAGTDAQKALMGRVMYILNNMPVIDDAEQVTRCRDCRHFEYTTVYGNWNGARLIGADHCPTCRKWGDGDIMTSEDGWCFLGEAKEDERNKDRL